MPARRVAVAAIDCQLRPFDGIVVELQHCTTARAEEMVVVEVSVDVLVLLGPRLGARFAGDPRARKEFDRPKDRGQSYPGTDSTRCHEKLVRRDMTFEAQERLQDGHAGCGQLLPPLVKMVPENGSLVAVLRYRWCHRY